MSKAIRVAVVPIDAVGHLTPMLAVCGALTRHAAVSAVRGFGSRPIASLFLRQGAEFEVTQRDHQESQGDLAWKSFVRPLGDAELAMQRMTEFAPDVVLYDPFAVHGALGAHVCRIPSAALVTMAGYGSLGDDFVRKYRWERQDLIAANAAYAARFGMDFRGKGMMPVLFPSQDLSMITAIERMAVSIDAGAQPLLHDAFRRVTGRDVCIGPCLGHSAYDVINALHGGTGAACEEPFPFDALVAARSAGRKVVVFSLGTVITDFRYGTPVGGQPTGEAFLRRALEVVAEAVHREGGLLVAAVGSKLPLSRLTMPSTAIVRPVLPLRQILQSSADAFITHHGASSQAESILAGVPMISLPGVGDQIANARVAARLGVAVAAWDLDDPFARCDVPAMRSALQAVLQSEEPKSACLKLAAEMRVSDGARAAADLVVAVGRTHRGGTAFPKEYCDGSTN